MRISISTYATTNSETFHEVIYTIRSPFFKGGGETSCVPLLNNIHNVKKIVLLLTALFILALVLPSCGQRREPTLEPAHAVQVSQSIDCPYTWDPITYTKMKCGGIEINYTTVGVFNEEYMLLNDNMYDDGVWVHGNIYRTPHVEIVVSRTTVIVYNRVHGLTTSVAFKLSK